VRTLKSIFCISLFVAASLNGQTAFFPWTNNSSYSGKWNINNDVPDYFASLLRNDKDTFSVSASTLKSFFNSNTENQIENFDLTQIISACNNFRAESAVTGSILTFNIDRIILGEPTVAGFESYSFDFILNYKIIDVKSGTVCESDQIHTTVSRNNLGLNLLGKPSSDKLEFYGLDKIPIGSTEFEKTLVAEGLREAALTLFTRLKITSPETAPGNVSRDENSSARKLPLSNNIRFIRGEILLFDKETGEAFINIGSNSGLKAGDKLFIYRIGDALYDPVTNENLGYAEIKKGELIITEVRGPKLSAASVVTDKSEIHKGLIVRGYFPEK
jgi:hypothetical protein